MLKYRRLEAFTSKRYDFFITKGSSIFEIFDVIPLPRVTFKHFSAQKMCKSHYGLSTFLLNRKLDKIEKLYVYD